MGVFRVKIFAHASRRPILQSFGWDDIPESLYRWEIHMSFMFCLFHLKAKMLKYYFIVLKSTSHEKTTTKIASYCCLVVVAFVLSDNMK